MGAAAVLHDVDLTVNNADDRADDNTMGAIAHDGSQTPISRREFERLHEAARAAFANRRDRIAMGTIPADGILQRAAYHRAISGAPRSANATQQLVGHRHPTTPRAAERPGE